MLGRWNETYFPFLDSYCWAMTFPHRFMFLESSTCSDQRYSSVRRVITRLQEPLVHHVFELFPGNFHQSKWSLLKCRVRIFPRAWLCGSVSVYPVHWITLRIVGVFAFAAWAFIWLSRRPKSLFALEQQSVKITHCIKIFSCRCSLLPVMFTQHFNRMQGHLKYRQLVVGCMRLQTRQSNVTSRKRMWYQLLSCPEIDRDAVECNVHFQQLDWAPNAKTCPRKAFSRLLTTISAQMLDLHEGIIAPTNSETSGKWDQECNFGCFWLIHWDVVPLSLLLRFIVGLGQI